MHACSVTLSCPTLGDLWTAACQAPLSMGFPRQGCWSRLPFPSPGDLPHPGIEPESPTLAGGSFYQWATWEAQRWDREYQKLLCPAYPFPAPELSMDRRWQGQQRALPSPEAQGHGWGLRQTLSVQLTFSFCCHRLCPLQPVFSLPSSQDPQDKTHPKISWVLVWGWWCTHSWASPSHS